MDQGRASRLETLLPLLACPSCRGGLRRDGDTLHCAGCSRQYPIVEGRPAFMPGVGELPRVMPAEKLSNQVGPDVIAMLEAIPGWSLHIGAGGTNRSIPRCVELEYTIFRNTDVASDAHALPFADGTFDMVVTFNTFEHLYDPPVAAREIYRVLKPGGRLLLDTAFLQPVHEAPHHYYNTTEYGLRRWFTGFEDVEVTVPGNFHPGNVLGWITSQMLISLETVQGVEARKRVAAMTLGEWADFWDKPELRGEPDYVASHYFPEHIKKGFSAGFQLTASKPLAAPEPAVAPNARSYRPAFRRLARWWSENSSR